MPKKKLKGCQPSTVLERFFTALCAVLYGKTFLGGNKRFHRELRKAVQEDILSFLTLRDLLNKHCPSWTRRVKKTALEDARLQALWVESARCFNLPHLEVRRTPDRGLGVFATTAGSDADASVKQFSAVVCGEVAAAKSGRCYPTHSRGPPHRPTLPTDVCASREQRGLLWGWVCFVFLAT
jgi:hypothetical protein